MRKIKFRGKSLLEGANGKRIWVYGDLITTSEGRAFIFPEDYDLKISNLREEYGVYSAIPILVEVDPETVGQYINRKDKNDGEIYEGDIIKADYGYGDPPCVVELKSFYYWLGEGCISDDIEVIGNIYDNPELLQEGK